MAILIIELNGTRRAGTLAGRVLIGRWADNNVMIDDRAVSRIHAWIGLQDGRYYVADAGSRSGTFVNGEALLDRHPLMDGDQIRIGPAILRYRADSTRPLGAEPIDLTPRTPEALSDKKGNFIDCVCGAPLWMPHDFTGVGQCRFCRHEVGRPAATTPAPTPRRATKMASVPARPEMTSPPPVSTPPSNDDFDALMDDAFSEEPTHLTSAGPFSAGLTPPDPPAAPKQIPVPMSSSAAPVPRDIRPPGAANAPAPGTRPTFPVSPATATAPQAPTAIPPPAPRPTTAAPPAIAAPFSGAPSSAAPIAPREQNTMCGVCHGSITVFDETTNCPACGLGFHSDCWEENRGCSAYGCSQVGALENKDSL